jgi:hypothetical protein
VADFKSGVPWQSVLSVTGPRRDPHTVFLHQIHAWFKELEAALTVEIARHLSQAGGGENPSERGAVWTYLTTDQPFGGWTERVLAFAGNCSTTACRDSAGFRGAVALANRRGPRNHCFTIWSRDFRGIHDPRRACIRLPD